PRLVPREHDQRRRRRATRAGRPVLRTRRRPCRQHGRASPLHGDGLAARAHRRGSPRGPPRRLVADAAATGSAQRAVTRFTLGVVVATVVTIEKERMVAAVIAAGVVLL